MNLGKKLPYYSVLIKKRRLAMGMTQKMLAQALKSIHKHDRVSKWETGNVVPSVKYSEKLAEVLGGQADEYRLIEKPQ